MDRGAVAGAVPLSTVEFDSYIGWILADEDSLFVLWGPTSAGDDPRQAWLERYDMDGEEIATASAGHDSFTLSGGHQVLHSAGPSSGWTGVTPETWATGQERWATDGYGVVVDAGVTYIGSIDGTLLPVDETTGGELWRQTEPDGDGAPSIRRPSAAPGGMEPEGRKDLSARSDAGDARAAGVFYVDGYLGSRWIASNGRLGAPSVRGRGSHRVARSDRHGSPRRGDHLGSTIV